MGGGVAGAVSRTLVSPLERLKILQQIQSAGREEYRLSVWRALVKIGREEGLRGFLRGNGTNCIRIIPYSAVQFGSYNLYKKVGSRTHTGFVCLTLNLFQVCRTVSERRLDPNASTCLWRSGGNHLCHCYLPARYCPHATLYPVSLLHSPRQQGSRGSATGIVPYYDHDVQERGRGGRPLPRHHSYRRWSRPLREFARGCYDCHR